MNMELNLEGRVENLHLPVAGALVPIYEAVINSIQAIEDCKPKKKGRITIEILREDVETQAAMAFGDRELPAIMNFKITDNGVGFNDANYTSFRTSDSRYKKSKGGKGIGRLFWLKAFEKVEIDSVYAEGGEARERAISLSVSSLAPSVPKKTARPVGTSVELKGFKAEYRKACKKKAESIADRLIEHCLIYFLQSNCPEIVISDPKIEDSKLSLNEIFQKNYGSTVKTGQFKVKGKEAFELKLVPLFTSEESSRLHWCANGREVFNEPLGRLVPNLKNRLRANDRPYVYMGYLSGKLLDEKVTADRSDFVIPKGKRDPDQESFDEADEITLEDISSAAAVEIKRLLEAELSPVEIEKKSAIQKFVNEEAPQYRALVSFEPSVIEQIPPGLNKEKLDQELHKAQYRFEAKTKSDISKVFSELQKADQKEVKKSVDEYFRRVSALNQANLAKYVLERKVVLDLFSQAIKQKDSGEFEKEDLVHGLVFPMRTTSDEVSFDEHNLWLVDEKLAYHSFLASDKQLRAVPAAKSDSANRPDVLVFNNPVVFSEGDTTPYSAVTMIEFKRPGRESSGDKGGRGPIKQLYDYVVDIREGHRRDKDNHELKVGHDTPFFIFLVCDLTKEMIRAAKDAGLTQSADAQGLFGYNPEYRTYVEVISYKKVLQDATKRNRAFFDKLGLVR